MNYKKILRFVCGLSLLFFMFAQLDTSLLQRIILDINGFTFLIAVIFCAIANLLCALRWESLSKAVGLNVSNKIFISVYFESIAANCILPGGILGGDIWRTTRIAKETKDESFLVKHDSKFSKNQLFKLSGLSVLVDRIHGFWSLCLMGITCFLLFFIFMPETFNKWSEELSVYLTPIFLYLIVLFCILILPILIKFYIIFMQTASLKIKFFLKFANDMTRNLWRVSYSNKTIIISLISQILFGVSFWICLHSIGINLNILLTLVLVPGIFLFASIPIGVAGFGPREAGSLFLLMPLSLNNEHIFISSVLFGLTSTVLGAITLLVSLMKSSKKN